MTAMIEIKNLKKEFGPILAVDGISFETPKGEVLGFLGPNGAGKSTTMKMVTGFLTPTSGTAVVCGHDVLDEPIQAKAKIGYLPEGAPLYGDMTPDGFFRFIAQVRGMPRSGRKRAIDRACSLLSLQGVMRQPIETLSKGFKRRVGLAQAILHDPPVLILDEPTDGLDPNQKHEVRDLIRQMASEKAIILSTHILEEVGAVCTRAIVIARGRIVADGTPEELESRSRRHNAVRLGVQAPTEAIVAELAKVQGVASIEPVTTDNGVARCMVFSRSGAVIVDGVARRVRELGWAVDELVVEPGRLDDVFRDLTTTGAKRSAR